jgi:hypothetical protein
MAAAARIELDSYIAELYATYGTEEVEGFVSVGDLQAIRRLRTAVETYVAAMPEDQARKWLVEAIMRELGVYDDIWTKEGKS